MGNNNRIVAAVLVCVCVGAAVYLLSGRYGEISERGHSHAMALISACNLKDEDRVKRIQTLINADLDAKAIGDGEAKWLNNIIDHALSGNWAAASRQVRELMNAQVKVNRTS